LVSGLQWFMSQRTERLRFLLGEKETVAYEAERISRRGRHRPTRKETIRVLVLTALFEGSDRARLQVYRALTALRPRHEEFIRKFRAKIVHDAEEFGGWLDLKEQRLDLTYLGKRLGQLDGALPWIAPEDVRPRT
jgi:hypothetical protein